MGKRGMEGLRHCRFKLDITAFIRYPAAKIIVFGFLFQGFGLYLSNQPLVIRLPFLFCFLTLIIL